LLPSVLAFSGLESTAVICQPLNDDGGLETNLPCDYYVGEIMVETGVGTEQIMVETGVGTEQIMVETGVGTEHINKTDVGVGTQ